MREKYELWTLSGALSKIACPPVTDEDARNKVNGIIPDITLQVGQFSRD
jgi:hypothetical protein